MAKAAREPAWWSPYKDAITPEFSAFLSYESAASMIRNFEPVLVPGLLQTQEYARATLPEMVPRDVDVDRAVPVDNLVRLRMQRQEILAHRPARPKLFFAFDEAVLYRWVGGPAVMCQQLEKIKAALVSTDSTIWIIPFGAGLYERMRGSYVLFELPTAAGGSEDILYIEDFRGELLIRDDLNDTAAYLGSFWNIEQIALRNEGALELVDRAIATMVRGRMNER
jgi:hypothetical protein